MMKDLTSIGQLTRAWIEQLFLDIDQGSLPALPDKILCTMFFEPSTRTRLSFESAALRLNMKVLSVENANTSSSAAKGESLADTLRLVGNYADMVVVRHPDNDAIENNSQHSPIPVINAGSGSNSHPTQALVDAYTIWKKLGRLDRVRIAFVGDIENSRTIKSLKELLEKFEGVEMHLFPALNQQLEQLLPNLDVIYLARQQKERGSLAENYFVFENRHADLMPPHAIILHALPRNSELPTEVDANPRAAYFDQAANAVKVRLAIISGLLK